MRSFPFVALCLSLAILPPSAAAARPSRGAKTLRASSRSGAPSLSFAVRQAGVETVARPNVEVASTTHSGLYVRGSTAAGAGFKSLLDRMVVRGLDTIVLDAKDYDGLLTYESRVSLAREAGAVHKPPIANFAEVIREAHAKKVRVAVRVSCFEDEWMARARPALSVQSKAGRPYRIGWLDPSNLDAQNYVIDLVQEAMDAGADEIQLDYVRYPVLGIKNADFHLEERGLEKTRVITDFVRRVHAMTHARQVPLALDVFGVVSFGKRSDIEALGQDPVLLAKECEILAPMVYPSHYAAGFNGFEEPGDHPELVGIAVRALRRSLDDAGVHDGAVLRPWLQAMRWKSPSYSPGYMAREIDSAKLGGAAGYLLWNPGQNYEYAWQAISKHEPRP